MMEETVLGYQAPLYGRRTAQYLLEPLQFKDTRLFYPSFDLEDQVRAYAVYGGTPAYLRTLKPQQSLRENILDGILSRGSFLYDDCALCFSRSYANRAITSQFCKPSRLAKPA